MHWLIAWLKFANDHSLENASRYEQLAEKLKSNYCDCNYRSVALLDLLSRSCLPRKILLAIINGLTISDIGWSALGTDGDNKRVHLVVPVACFMAYLLNRYSGAEVYEAPRAEALVNISNLSVKLRECSFIQRGRSHMVYWPRSK